MPGLEDILRRDTLEIRDFYIEFLRLNDSQAQQIKKYWPKISINQNLEYHAALLFSNGNDYIFEFRPEAVGDTLAKAEEVGHYFSLILNPHAKKALFKAEKGSMEHIAAVAQQEYIARMLALEYLKYKGIQGSNNLWSKLDNNKIILLTEKPSDILSHYAGYLAAEQDLNNEAGTKNLIKALYSNDAKRFARISEKLGPRIHVLPPNSNYDAPYAIAA